MPNWVTNTVKAENWNILKEKLTRVIIDEKEAKELEIKVGDRIVDFNILLPRPKELDIVSGSGSYMTSRTFQKDKLQLQKCLIDPFLAEKYNGTLTQDEFVEAVKNSISLHLADFIQVYDLSATDEQKLNDNLDNIIKGFYNLHKFGCTDWYDWSIKTWGTKWNASLDGLVIDENAQVIYFQTAWSMPYGIIEELSKFTPVTIAFADEDIGSNYGIFEFVNGIVNENILDSRNGSMGEALAIQGYGEDYIEEYFGEENYTDEDIQEYWSCSRDEHIENVRADFKNAEALLKECKII